MAQYKFYAKKYKACRDCASLSESRGLLRERTSSLHCRCHRRATAVDFIAASRGRAAEAAFNLRSVLTRELSS